MKSNEFIKKTHHKGTYAGVHFSEETKDAIMDYITENKIPNAPERDKMHTTLLYSRKRCPNYEPASEVFMRGKPGAWQVWESQPDSTGKVSNCLVLEFECPELNERHEQLMQEHQATFDYPEYKTHVTFSYDVGEMNHKELPPFESDIEIIEEYGEVLDLDWAQNNTN